jgi:hypothetical protein
MHASFDRALKAALQRAPKVDRGPAVSLEEFRRRLGLATPPMSINPPPATKRPDAVRPSPAHPFGDPTAQVTDLEVADARHTDTSEVQKRRRRRDAENKAREVRERTHVTVRLHGERDDHEEATTGMPASEAAGGVAGGAGGNTHWAG